MRRFFAWVIIILLYVRGVQLVKFTPYIKDDFANNFKDDFANNPQTNVPNTSEIATPTALKVYLHVGPGKMATTTIQRAMVRDQYELHKENFCVYENFGRAGEMLNGGQNGNKNTSELLKVETIKDMLIFFDYCHNTNQHMLLSSEFVGHLEKETWEEVLKPSLDRWNITIVVGYRRFYSWAPSVWFQIMRQRISEWPENENDVSSLILPFHQWYHSNALKLKMLYTGYYIQHWRGELGIKDFLVYNVHEDINLLKHFYCSILGLHYTCKKHSEEMIDEKKDNAGFSLHYDRLACALFFKGYIDPKKTSRSQAGEKIKDFYSLPRNAGIMEQPVLQSCFNNNQMKDVLEKSKKLELELVPNFYASSKGKVTLEDKFESNKQSMFCEVNVTSVINQHGTELMRIFL